MSEQGKRLQRQKQEDAVFNRMLLWLAGCVVVEGLSLLIRWFYLNYTYMVGGLDAFFYVFRFLGAVLFVAGCVWTGLTLFRRGGKAVLPLACTGAVLWVWVVAILCYGYNLTGMIAMCVLPAVVAVLAAIFFLYQREFFFVSFLIGVGIAALWVYRQIYMDHPRMTYCGFAAVWVLLALAALAAFQLSRRDGKLGALRVFPAKTVYLPIYLTCVVVALALPAALLVGVSAALYVMFVLIGWLFCLAVYYTVKLM